MNRQIRTMDVLILLAVIAGSQSGSIAVRADDDEGLSQYIYKTIGNRVLHAEILYPDDWTASNGRPAIVFFVVQYTLPNAQGCKLGLGQRVGRAGSRPTAVPDIASRNAHVIGYHVLCLILSVSYRRVKPNL